MSTPSEIAEMSRRIEELVEDPREFRTWLERQSDYRVVGSRGITNACPIARFIYDVSGAPFPSVDVGTRTITFMENSIPTPAWAASFIRLVDRHVGYRGVQSRTARQILASL